MKMSRLVFGMLLGCWCLFLFIQWGNPFDETEHAHVAWLMGHQRRRPLRDFFQHHQPLLWDLLQTYYLAGGTGPEVLYYGRGIVVACAVLFSLGVVLVARRAAVSQGAAGRPAGALGVLPVLAFSLAFPTSFTIRPETVAAVPFVYAVLLWLPARGHGPPGLAGSCLSGLLFGASVFASPRFALLAGAFLLVPKDPAGPALPRAGHLAALGLGAAGFALGYGALTGCGVAVMRFNLEFTSLLTKAGAGGFGLTSGLLLGGLASAAAGAVVFVGLRGRARRRFLAQGGYLALVCAASVLSAWPFLYTQNLFAPAVWFSIMLACAEGDLDWGRNVFARFLPRAAALACAAVPLVCTLRDVREAKTIVARVEQKKALLALLRPGDKVMMAAPAHPICAEDASYYSNPVVDGRDRLRESVRQAGPRWGLPECAHLEDIIRERPALVDGFMFEVLREPERQVLTDILNKEYDPVPWMADCDAAFFRMVFQRKR